MAIEIPLIASTAPSSWCFSGATSVLNLIQNYMVGYISGDISLFNYGATTPAAEYQDRPWIKLNADGTLDDLYVYQNGEWRTKQRFPTRMIAWIDVNEGNVTLPWAPCNGNGGVQINGQDIPDLRDRFIVAAGSTYALNATGGEATHTLTVAEMPSHTHTISNSRANGANYTAPLGSSDGIGYNDITLGSTGGGGTHNNLPPYFALTPIIYVGYTA